MSVHQNLSRRERQIMDVIYARGEATVGEVLEDLPDPPTYSAVRAMLRKLEAKGHLGHDAHGARYVYRPTVPASDARDNALDRIMRTFFGGSPSKTVAAILEQEDLSRGELDELAGLIEQARRRGQ